MANLPLARLQSLSLLQNDNVITPKLSDFILHVNVVAGFSLRFPSSDEFMTISCKLRNLKVAATKIAQCNNKNVALSQAKSLIHFSAEAITYLFIKSLTSL